MIYVTQNLKNQIVTAMSKTEDLVFEQLLEEYNDLLKDLNIGYPISDNVLNSLWELIHKRHYILYESDLRSVFNLLEYHEYL